MNWATTRWGLDVRITSEAIVMARKNWKCILFCLNLDDFFKGIFCTNLPIAANICPQLGILSSTLRLIVLPCLLQQCDAWFHQSSGISYTKQSPEKHRTNSKRKGFSEISKVRYSTRIRNQASFPNKRLNWLFLKGQSFHKSYTSKSTF